jgi:hypothetical protein
MLCPFMFCRGRPSSNLTSPTIFPEAHRGDMVRFFVTSDDVSE